LFIGCIMSNILQRIIMCRTQKDKMSDLLDLKLEFEKI